MFEDLKTNFPDLKRLVCVTPEEIAEQKETHPGLPDAYLMFLQEIGFGNLGDIQIYLGLIPATEVYPSRTDAMISRVVLFGDDLQGYCFGFDPSCDYGVIEVDPKGNIRSLDRTFEQQVRRYLA